MFSVEIIGLNPIIDGLENSPKTVKRVSSTHLNRLGPVVVGNVRLHTPQDTGKLWNAIGDEVESIPLSVILTVKADESVKPVVVSSVAHGTVPHWPPWGPGSNLAGWAERKGIPVFLVARAISRRGTIKRYGGPSKGAEMFDKGLKDSQSDISSMERDLEIDLAKELI